MVSFSRIFLNKVHHVKRTCAKLFILTVVSQVSFQVFAVAEGSWVTVQEATVEQSRVAVKRGVGLFTFNDIALPVESNISDTLRLVITQSSHDVMTPDGIDENTNPYFDIDSVDASTQIFFAMKRAAFSYSIELQQFVIPAEPEAIVFDYDFNLNQIQTDNNNWEGWVYPTNNRGVMAFEEGLGEDGTAAYSFTDSSTNINIFICISLS